jgi:hypothetical protein
MRTATKKSGLPASVEKYIGVETGRPAPGGRIPVDTPMHISQRPYKRQNVFKYIARVGGVDWNLFGYATAVKRKSDGQMAVINGQHRINLVKLVLPNVTEVPAQIIEVDDQEFEVYASALFSQFNGQTQKSLSNEELFHSQVLALDPDALYMKTILEKCGLSCGTVNAGALTHPVVYATFAKCLKLSDTATVRAVELMKKGFKTVADDPLHGLVFLLSHPTYSVLGDTKTKVGKEFEIWFTQAVPMFHSLNDLRFKKYRNNPSWQKGIAYGLVKSFNNYQRKHSGTVGPAIKEIRQIYEQGFKDEDSGLLD